MAPPLSVHPRILACFRSASTIDSVVLEWRAARPVKNVATLTREALYALVEVTENGRCRRVSKLEVGVKRKCCNFENGDGGRPERSWAARFQAARSNSWSMN